MKQNREKDEKDRRPRVSIKYDGINQSRLHPGEEKWWEDKINSVSCFRLDPSVEIIVECFVLRIFKHNKFWFPILLNLSEFVDLYKVVGLVLESQRLEPEEKMYGQKAPILNYEISSPFRRSVVIISFHNCLRFLETNVVEARERSAINVADCVIGNQKMFLPSHKHEIGFL